MSLIGDLQWQTPLTVTVVCHQGSPGGSAGKESAGNAEDLGEGNGYPLQYSGLKDSKSMESQRVRHDWSTFTFTSVIA